MALRRLVSRADLIARYPHSDVSDFVPTHRVLVHTGSELVRDDFVSLGEPEGKMQSGFVPGQKEPDYVIVYPGTENERWQVVSPPFGQRVAPHHVRYLPDYVRPSEQKNGFVYFAAAGSRVKIGWSQDVDRRLDELQVANPVPLRLLGKVAGSMGDEKEMHRRFRHLHVHGEWFENGPEIGDFLEDARTGL